MTNEEHAEQPVVCRSCQVNSLTKWNATGLCPECRRKVPVGAAAGSHSGSIAERTAFACSALLSLAAGWEEEMVMRREIADQKAKDRDYIGALKTENEAWTLHRCAQAIRDEMWRAGLS